MRSTLTVVGLLALLTAGCGQPPARSPDSPATATSSDDETTADEVAALLEQSRSQEFHIVYLAHGAPEEGIRRSATHAGPAFAWRESDSPTAAGRTYAFDLVQRRSGEIVSCTWTGQTNNPRVNEWECARIGRKPDGLFGEFFGGMLFGSGRFQPQAVAEQGWDSTRRAEHLGGESLCGWSAAFAPEVEEVCIDLDTGIPVAVVRDGVRSTAEELREPRKSDFTPPAKPQDRYDDADH